MSERTNNLRIVLAAFLMGLANCAQIVGIEEGEPRAECKTVADCKSDVPECRTASACTMGACVYENAKEGTLLAEQVEGDCRAAICDGAGKSTIIAIPSDTEDDKNPCTEDTCDVLMPVHKPIAQYDCYDGPMGTVGMGICKMGVHHCDASGNAVGMCEGQILPQVETCDTAMVDEDCNGVANETGPEGGSCTCGDGVISAGIAEECDDGAKLDGDVCSPLCKAQQVVDVKLGGFHACIRTSTGQTKCWGENQYGQLGGGNVLDVGDEPADMGASLAQTMLGLTSSATSMSFGLEFGCAILADMTLRCWGRNDRGQLGEGNKLDRGDGPDEMGDKMPAISLGTNVHPVALSAGRAHICVLLNTGDVKCWGANGAGQLGLENALDRGDGPNEMGVNLPTVNLGTARKAKAIAAGNFHTCAILDNDTLKCWGLNGNGQLGQGDTATRGDMMGQMGDALKPIDLGTGRTAKAITAGSNYTCALLDDGNVKCWGINDVGQLGQGDALPRGNMMGQMGDALAAINLGMGRTATAIVASDLFACALLDNGTLKCWGSNASGQLGQGDAINRGDKPMTLGDALLPIDFGAGSKVAAVDVGVGFGCALLDNDRVKCWGVNGSGRLGQGDTNDRGNMPNQMGDNLPPVKFFSDVW